MGELGGRGGECAKPFAGARALTMRFLSDRCGATAIEYAIIGGGVAVVIAATVFTVGSTIEMTLYGKVAEGLQGQ